MTALPDLTQVLWPGVCGFASVMPATEWTLHDLERRAVASAVETRVAEFTAGRYCAHQALRMLGEPDVAIPSGADRADVAMISTISLRMWKSCSTNERRRSGELCRCW